jgi:beta-glucosidase
MSPVGTPLCDTVHAGLVPVSAVDERVRRTLRLAGRVGALEGVEPAIGFDADLANPTDLMREAATDGMVLMRRGMVQMQRAV